MTGTLVANPSGNAIWNATNKDAVFIFEFSRLGADAPTTIGKNTIQLKSTINYDSDARVEIPSPVVLDTITTDRSYVASASPVGALRLSPILLDTDLPPQVEVTVMLIRANRQPERLLFTNDNQKVLQSYISFTSEAKTSIPWSYQVQVTVKGKFPKPSLQCSGP